MHFCETKSNYFLFEPYEYMIFIFDMAKIWDRYQVANWIIYGTS